MKEQKKKFIEFAKAEAEAQNSSNSDKNCGESIEKYLSPFRKILNQNGKTNMFDNLKIGYDWCGAFVHYCLTKSGYAFQLQPFANEPTLALVFTWYKSAIANNKWIDDFSQAEKGDLIIFKDAKDEKRQYKHIGIILEIDVKNQNFTTAEGNVKYLNENNEIRRKTNIVNYSKLDEVKGFIKI